MLIYCLKSGFGCWLLYLVTSGHVVSSCYYPKVPLTSDCHWWQCPCAGSSLATLKRGSATKRSMGAAIVKNIVESKARLGEILLKFRSDRISNDEHTNNLNQTCVVDKDQHKTCVDIHLKSSCHPQHMLPIEELAFITVEKSRSNRTDFLKRTFALLARLAVYVDVSSSEEYKRVWSDPQEWGKNGTIFCDISDIVKTLNTILCAITHYPGGSIVIVERSDVMRDTCVDLGSETSRNNRNYIVLLILNELLERLTEPMRTLL